MAVENWKTVHDAQYEHSFPICHSWMFERERERKREKERKKEREIERKRESEREREREIEHYHFSLKKTTFFF